MAYAKLVFMKNKHLTLVIVVAIISQIALISYLAMNNFASNAGIGWKGIIISSWPLVFPVATIAYAFPNYKGIKGWVGSNRLAAAVLIGALLYILSILLYASAIFYYGF